MTTQAQLDPAIHHCWPASDLQSAPAAYSIALPIVSALGIISPRLRPAG